MFVYAIVHMTGMEAFEGADVEPDFQRVGAYKSVMFRATSAEPVEDIAKTRALQAWTESDLGRVYTQLDNVELEIEPGNLWTISFWHYAWRRIRPGPLRGFTFYPAEHARSTSN